MLTLKLNKLLTDMTQQLPLMHLIINLQENYSRKLCRTGKVLFHTESRSKRKGMRNYPQQGGIPSDTGSTVYQVCIELMQENSAITFDDRNRRPHSTVVNQSRFFVTYMQQQCNRYYLKSKLHLL